MANRSVIKYYHPQAHSFDSVPTNVENGTSSSRGGLLGQPPRDILHPPDMLSSTSFSRPYQNLRPKRTALVHEDILKPPSEMTQDPQSTSQVVGSGIVPGSQPLSTRRGRRRAAIQGDIISIPNELREKSLAETRLKRARRDDDEFPDHEEDVKLDDQRIAKRGKISCDQCNYRKIKVLVSLLRVPYSLIVPQEDRLQASERTFPMRSLRQNSNHM